jgi:hypothetical protein
MFVFLKSWEDRGWLTKLSALRTGSVTAAETQNDASKNTCETDNKNRTKN